MTHSPLEFAREFSALKSRVAHQPVSDTKLLLLADFWPRLAAIRDNNSFRSYFDEYRALFADLISAADFSDCTPDELQRLAHVADSLNCDLDRAIMKNLIRAYAWLGETEKAVELALSLTEERTTPVPADPATRASRACDLPVNQNTMTPPVPAGPATRASGACDLPDNTIPDSQDLRSERDRLLAAIDLLRERAPKTAELLNQIALDWESDSGHLWFDRARCLFVESDGSSLSRGRMRTFVGTVERSADTRRDRDKRPPDEVTFENQVKSADDPFIGVVYHALSAVRNLLDRDEGGMSKDTVPLKARYEIAESKQTVTGDSIGLASAVIAYAQLLRPEILRYDRFVSSEVAFTGSIAPDGRLLAVNHDSLATKLRRAFCSPIRHLVIPKACADTAETILYKLRKQYPRRRLQLIAAEHLRDVIEDRNIVRTERVCIGQFVGRKAGRWTRTTKVQVPLLVVLIYVLLAIVWTRTFAPWRFDWHIAKVEILKNRIRTINNDGEVLWVSEPFEYELDSLAYEVSKPYYSTDSDGDGRDELFLSIVSERIHPSLAYFEDDGRVVWRVDAAIKTTYPGDTQYPDRRESFVYHPAGIVPYVDKQGRQYVLTSCAASYPWRHQIMSFDTSGKISGPYLSTGAGALGHAQSFDFDKDGEKELLFAGRDNHIQRVVCLALNPRKLDGVNPPYDDARFVLSGLPRGSHIGYVSLPETPLSEGSEVKSTSVEAIKFSPTERTFRVAVAEGHGLMINNELQIDYAKLPKLYWELDSNLIPISLDYMDGSRALINDWLIKTQRSPIEDFYRLKDSLLKEVIVYHGNTLVHHPAKGIHFSRPKSN